MKISKQLNNNIVIAADGQGREVVLMGKGIGFGVKPGEAPNMDLVEKRFFGLSSGAHTDQLAELLERIPLEHFSLGMQVAEHIQENIKTGSTAGDWSSIWRAMRASSPASASRRRLSRPSPFTPSARAPEAP